MTLSFIQTLGSDGLRRPDDAVDTVDVVDVVDMVDVVDVVDQ